MAIKVMDTCARGESSRINCSVIVTGVFIADPSRTMIDGK